MDELWGVDAPCSGATGVFFPPVDELRSSTWVIAKLYEQATVACETCPLVFACHARWIAAGQPDTGVWFGTTPKQRQKNLVRYCHRCKESLDRQDMSDRRLLHPACAEANRAERYQRTA